MVEKFWLNTLEHSRMTLARLIRDYHANEEGDTVRFKATVNALNVYLSYWRLEKDMQIEDEIQAIREHVGMV